MKKVCSDSFMYDSDIIIKCDGNYHEDIGVGGVAWVIINNNTREVIVEGGKSINSSSSSESERKSIQFALEDIKYVKSLETIDSVRVQTDCVQIIESVSNNNSDLVEKFDILESWCIEKTDRSDIERAHSIADYMVKDK